MSLQARIGRMETASPPPRSVRIEAKDEADCQEQLERLLLSSIKSPGPIDVEIHINDEIRREHMNILSFEEYLELLD